MTSTVTTFLMLEFGIVANEIFVFANYQDIWILFKKCVEKIKKFQVRF